LEYSANVKVVGDIALLSSMDVYLGQTGFQMCGEVSGIIILVDVEVDSLHEISPSYVRGEGVEILVIGQGYILQIHVYLVHPRVP